MRREKTKAVKPGLHASTRSRSSSPRRAAPTAVAVLQKPPVRTNSYDNWGFGALCSHDFVRRSGAPQSKAERTLRLAFAAPPRALYTAFCLSSFTYMFVGTLMLLWFNRRLPSVFITSVPFGLDRFSLLLVVQGPVSWWADVWARTRQCKAQHVAYLADRLLATSMTILTFFIGNVCWRPHSSPVQRGLAALSLFGLVPFALSQRALAHERFVPFMAWHVAWHVSIPVVAITWLVYTAHWAPLLPGESGTGGE